MDKFLDWCANNSNPFINTFTFLSIVLLSTLLFVLLLVTIVLYPLISVPIFGGVWYLIYLKYKKENT